MNGPVGKRLTGVGVGVLVVVLVWAVFQRDEDGAMPPLATAMNVAELLGGGQPPPGFSRATAPRTFSFPADHGPHDDFQAEWWYFTGNLKSDVGREFGFQLTFFRFAIAPPSSSRPNVASGTQVARASSNWRTRQVYMAHYALTDVATDRFVSAERFQRQSLGLSGAEAQPFSVWLGDWSVRGPAQGESIFPLRLAAAHDGYHLGLTLRPLKPLVFHGDRGFSRKSAASGNASYYYSFPRLAVAGNIRLPDSTVRVSGTGWLDREWSTSALAANQVGWDWFALHLADGTDLMLAYIRRDDGSFDPASFGTLVYPDGRVEGLGLSDSRIDVLGHWRSPQTGVVYPARWQLLVPDKSLRLRLEPKLAGQEMIHSVRYWEGALRVSGTADGRPVTGSGYAELAGYGPTG